MHTHRVTALHNRLHELAADTGRLRRSVPEESLLEWRADRIANHVEALIGMVEPTAAEIAAWTYPGDDQAVDEAIRVVDERARRLHKQLGWRQ